MQEAEEAQEQDLQYEYDLVNQLEILRIFYATASKESEKVVLAYGNYEKVATNGIQHLEKALDLLNIPLPASGPGNGNTADDTVDMDLSDDENNTDKRTFIPPASPSGEAQKEMEPIDDDDDDVPYSPPVSALTQRCSQASVDFPRLSRFVAVKVSNRLSISTC